MQQALHCCGGAWHKQRVLYLLSLQLQHVLLSESIIANATNGLQRLRSKGARIRMDVAVLADHFTLSNDHLEKQHAQGSWHT
jgi:hypothetical protein